jgi:hypothetical protein
MATGVFAPTHHSRTVAHARRVGEGAAVFTGALGLVERWKVVREAGNGLLEERETVPAVG